MKSPFLTSVLVLSVLCLFIGCGDGGKQVMTSEASYADGVQAFGEKQFEEAEASFSRALNLGALNVDCMCDARLKRAKARIELSDFEGAQEDLDFLMEGAPDTTAALAMSGELALLRGDKDEAKKFYADARKANPRIAIPTELR